MSHPRHQFSAASIALLLALSGFQTAADERQIQIGGFKLLPQSTTEVGIGGILGDARYFGAFNGMNDDGAYAIVNTDLFLRDETTGTWLRLTGIDLGLDSREARFEHERQGDWKYFIDLTQTTYSNPLFLTSGLTGNGGPNQNVTGTARRQLDLEVGRDQLSLGFSKQFGDKTKVAVEYRHEEKRGARQFGAQGSGALPRLNFLSDPINYVTREVSGTASYAGEQLQLTGGYLGSFFTNAYDVLNNNSDRPQISLPMDNQAHQLHLAGGYAITPTTRATFKASYGVALQNEGFFSAPTIAGNGRNDLGGRVDTALAQIGLTARPIRKLAIRGSLRHEERDDKTKRAQYINPSTSRTGLNIPYSRKTTTGKLEASYALPMQVRIIGGLRQEHWSRSKPVLRQASFRDNTNETSFNLELRRSLVDSIGGSVSYTRSMRSGSSFNDGTDGRIDAINLGNRDRDKARLALDWAPTDNYSAQLGFEYSHDTYDSRPLGPIERETRLVSLDMNYAISKGWTVAAWATLNDVRLDQATNGDGTSVSGAAVNNEDWAADLRHVGKAVGLTVRGTLMKGLAAGADAQYATDRSEQEIIGLGSSALPDLPDVRYRQAAASLFLDYSLASGGNIKLSYGYSRLSADDWTWQGIAYADGTTVQIPERQETHIIGVSYRCRW